MILSLIASCALAAAPTPCVSESGAPLRYPDGVERWVYSFPTCTPTPLPQGAWVAVVTATVTRTPKPNAEATCVAKGHEWEGCSPQGYRRIVDDCVPSRGANGVTWAERCRRCGLWRETR